MNYEQMSDFEINKLVAEHLNPNAAIEYDWSNSEGRKKSKRGVVVCPMDSRDAFLFNPCNNPSHAWPIIEQMLSQDVTLAINSHGVMSSNFGSKLNGFSFDVEGSPLRAIMIGYLMMQEQECNT